MMKRIKSKNREKLMFWAGALLGISGGIIGNILVSSSFTLINNSCKNEICYYGSFGLMFLSFIIFLVIMFFIMKQIKKVNKSERA